MKTTCQKLIEILTRIIPVADPGGGGAKGAMAPPSVPDKDYLLCTSWHFLLENPLLRAKQ